MTSHRPVIAALTLIALATPALAQQPALPPPAPAAPAAAAETLLVTDLTSGIGNEVLPGMIAIVHYTGWLYDEKAPGHHGKQFDSSRERGQPLSVPVGAGRVIKGWEQGLPGMKVGGMRRLVIPPSLGYGGRNVGNGLIPPNSTLVFEIELLAVETVTLTPQAQ
jgi:FKBP-type peptidyl-prolyl cis-trans isomerase FkpA